MRPQTSKSEALQQIESRRLNIIHVYGMIRSQRATARELHVSRNTVRLTIRNYKMQGTIDDAERSGRTVATGPATDRLIVRKTKADPFLAANDVAEAFAEHLRVSVRTTKKWFNAAGSMGTWKPSREKPATSKTNARKRLAFAK